MLAKITSKNQLTLPKSVTDAIDPTTYFDVEVRCGQVILTPVRIQRGDAVRAKLAELALTEADIRDALAWGRADASVDRAAESTRTYRVAPSRKRAMTKRPRKA